MKLARACHKSAGKGVSAVTACRSKAGRRSPARGLKKRRRAGRRAPVGGTPTGRAPTHVPAQIRSAGLPDMIGPSLPFGLLFCHCPCPAPPRAFESLPLGWGNILVAASSAGGRDRRPQTQPWRELAMSTAATLAVGQVRDRSGGMTCSMPTPQPVKDVHCGAILHAEQGPTLWCHYTPCLELQRRG